MEILKMRLVHEDAKVPTRSNPGDAGLDLYTIESAVIPPGQSAKFRTGIHMSIPYGYAGLIWPRSKLADRYKLEVLAGVVDAPYRGEVKISLLNSGHKPVEINKGDKIAQMLVQPVELVNIMVVSELDETERGSKGIDDLDLRRR